MCSRILLVCVLLGALVSGVCLAATVNINPHKIVLNAQGAADDVQANIPIYLPSALIENVDVTLSFDGIIVAKAIRARYCVIDDILIIDFDRTELQDNEDVQDMANSTVIATVVGSVTVMDYITGEPEEIYFSGSDMVEIVKPGKKGL
jgi:hypothetical protein